MKIQNLKTKVIGPILLLIPMACMHLGDGHHSGDHYSSIHQRVPQNLAPDHDSKGMMEQGWIISWRGGEM